MQFRKFTLIGILLTSLVLAACQRHSDNAPSAAQVSTAIDQILQEFPENTTMGIIVQDLPTGKILYELNPTRSFVPASVIKVLTATTALHYLGPDFRFTTLLATDKPIENGVIMGNLYVDFSGDPSLQNTDLLQLLAKLKQKNIQQIKGDIIVDHTPYVDEEAGPGFMWDDENICYSALSNGIILDRNCFEFRLYPNTQINRPAALVSEGTLEFTPLHNTVTTELSSANECYATLMSNRENKYDLSGCIPYHSNPQYFDVAIRNPNLYAINYIKKAITQQHIQLRGQIKLGTIPPKLTILAVHQSAPLSELIQEVLANSDNLYANTLFKMMGAVYFNGPANWHYGAEAMIALLNEMHIDTEYNVIVDGAGLSRYNRVTPKTLLDTFDFAYENPNLFSHLLSAMASSGKKGTLRYFFLEDSNSQFVGKTGSMTGVKALAGVLTQKGQPKLLFIMMVNGSSSGRDYTKLSNQIVNKLYTLTEQK